MAETRKIGEFELLEPLHGGTHPLFKARDAAGNVVALKAIPLSAASEEQRERFLREAEIAKSLDHPNLLKVMASGAGETHLYQVMEMLEGSDLRKILAQKTALSWEQRLQIMEQVCDGLGYAHYRGLVHRDLKPANLFVENSGRVRILDFGMARIQDSKLTQAGVALGTLNYMAPEQIRGEKCTAASDVFSCGIIFYELITGRHPFSHGSSGIQEILTAMLFQPPAALRGVAPDAPAGIENVIGQALEKDPGRRPQNASELRGMLRSCRMGAQTPQAPAPVQAPDLGATRKIKRPDVEALKAMKLAAEQAAPKPVAPAPAPVVVQKAAASVPRAETVYCPACTQANPKGASVCKHCGASLMATSTKMAAMQPEKASSSSQWILAGVIVVVILAVTVFLLTKN
ncbi:MAG: protein kinase [Bryobacterales bacterium]|nr:protein kinase [Bryobacterales bacterium]